MNRIIRILAPVVLFLAALFTILLGNVGSEAAIVGQSGYATSDCCNFFDGTLTNDGTLKDFNDDTSYRKDGVFSGSNYTINSGLHLNQKTDVATHSKVEIAMEVFCSKKYTVELYIQDFQPGTGYSTGEANSSYLLSVGKSGLGAKFGIVYRNDLNIVQIRFNNVFHSIDFGNALANLQDTLLTVTVNTEENWFAVYLNGTFLKKVTNSSITSFTKDTDVDYAYLCDNGGCWCSFTLRSLRVHSAQLEIGHIKQNYAVDRAKYNKDVLDTSNNVPTWEDYKIDNYLVGYFAGQDPLISDYGKLVTNLNSQTNIGNVSYKYDGIKSMIAEAGDKPYLHYWQNLADNTHGAGLWNTFKLTLTNGTSGKINGYKASYIDKDGYHLAVGDKIYLFSKTDNDTLGDYTDYGTTVLHDYTDDIVNLNSSFTIEAFLGDFDTSNTDDDSIIFKIGASTAPNQDDNEGGNSELVLCHRNNDGLILICNGLLDPNDTYIKINHNDPNSNNYTDLSDKLFSVVYNTTDVKVYVDGALKATINKDSSPSLSTWDYIQLGSSHTLRDTACTYRCVRVYTTALTAEQISANYTNDVKLYKKTTTTNYKTPTKQTTSYGLCGFDKIFEKSGSLNTAVTKELKTVGTNVNNSIGEGGYVNELLNDWEPSTGLYITRTEKLKYYVASLNDGQKTENGVTKYTSDRTPIRIDTRATFYDMKNYVNGSADNGCNYLRGRLENSEQIKNSAMESTGFTTTNNGALCIQNSFYMRSKYKCGSSVVSVDTVNKINGYSTISSTKLMVTADIRTISLRDTDFCGMVIDFSDDIWNKYDSNVDYSGYGWTYNNSGTADTGKARDDSMYTNFDKALSYTGYGRTSLFETGVGFNLMRRAGTYDDTQGGNDSTYIMRIFVGGDGTSANKTSYLDLVIDSSSTSLATNNKSDDKFTDTEGMFHSTLTNFTIYREYTNWPYDKFEFTSNKTTYTIDKGYYVYMVKFYVNKVLRAIVVMKAAGIKEDDTTKKDYMPVTDTGFIIPVKDDGSLDVSKAVKTITMKKWCLNCNYGIEGANNGGTYTDTAKWAPATASGNILFAVHRENNKFQTGKNDDGTGDGYQMTACDEDLCRIVIDNIGYMDYHDTQYTQKTYSGSYIVNKDMTFNLASSLIFARKVFEPEVYFNRLGYDSSLLKYSELLLAGLKSNFSNGQLSVGTITYKDIKYTKEDYNASHNKTKLNNGYKLNGDSNSYITMYTNLIDGVYFKDICDDITYDLIDFNGETMFAKNYKAIDYFTNLYILNKGTSEQKQALLAQMGLTEVPSSVLMSDNQIYVMLDIIELGKAHSDYAKYYKLSGQFEGQDIGKLEDFTVSTTNPLIDTSSVIGSNYAKNLIDAKPAKISTNNDKNSTAFFKSFALALKSNISILVTVQVPTSWSTQMSDHFKVYYSNNGGTKGEAYNLVSYNTSDITSYHDGEYYKNKNTIVTSIVDAGDGNSYVTIPITLSITDFNKQFYIELIAGEDTCSTYVYGLYNYCASKWNNSDRTLSEFCRRLFHLGELVQYYDNDKQTFELWAKTSEYLEEVSHA